MKKSIFLALPFALFLGHILWFQHLHDDAYISFRYAGNLEAGSGLVFNPGERVEGYTNFLWTLALALFMKCGLGPEIVSHVLNFLFGFGVLVLLYVFVGELLEGPEKRVYLAPFLFALSPSASCWTLSGMEMAMFSFAMLLGLLLYHRGQARGGGAHLALGSLLLALSAWTRPEGFLVFGIVFLHFIYYSIFQGGRSAKSLSFLLLPFIILTLSHIAWRYAYYGFLFPNTFYAKVSPSLDLFKTGLDYMGSFFFPGGVLFSLVLFFAWRKFKEPLFSLLFVIAVLYSLYLVSVGGDFYVYHRFGYPLVALFALLGEAGWSEVVACGRSQSLGAVKKILHPAAIALVLFILVPWTSFTGAYREPFKSGTRSDDQRKEAGLWLKDHAPPQATIALNPVGIVPYESGLGTIDMLGLTNTRIAHEPSRTGSPVIPAHDKYDPDYVLSLKPTYIVTGGAALIDPPPEKKAYRVEGILPFEYMRTLVDRDRLYFPGDGILYDNPEFKKQYSPRIAKIGSLYFYYFLFDEIAEALEKKVKDEPADAARLAELAAHDEKKGLYNEARKLFLKAKELDSNHEERYKEFMGSLAARAPLLRAPEGPEAGFLNQAGELLRRGDVEQAERLILKSKEVNPTSAVVWFNLGIVHELKNEYDRAVEAYGTSLELDPSFADAYNNLGSVYARLGKMVEAVENWEAAVLLDPSSPARQNLETFFSGLESGQVPGAEKARPSN